MPITLTAEQEAFVTERMQKNGFASPEETLDAFFGLAREQDATQVTLPLEVERQLVREGIEALNAGRYRTFDSADEVADSVIASARRKAGL